jgi:glycosyltransferase involved in cell wall biosynthesis
MCQNLDLVTVVVHTYNQDKFIAECLDGIISQDIFPEVRILIIDDCSSDSTQNIGLSYRDKYPNQIVVVSHVYNQLAEDYLIGLDSYVQIKSKYIAWCDGDDYWFSPEKLRMQIEILESNQNISIVHTNYLQLVEEELGYKVVHRQTQESIKASRVTTGKSLVLGNIIKHSTAVVSLQDIDFNFIRGAKGIYAGDWLIYISATRSKKIHYLDEETTAVRINNKGIWNGQSQLRNNLQKDLIREYSALALPKSLLRQRFRTYLLIQRLRRRVSRSVLYRPIRSRVWKIRTSLKLFSNRLSE